MIFQNLIHKSLRLFVEGTRAMLTSVLAYKTISPLHHSIEMLWCKNTVTAGDKAFYYPSRSNSNFSYKLVQCLFNKHLFHKISYTQGIDLSNSYAKCKKIKY